MPSFWISLEDMRTLLGEPLSDGDILDLLPLAKTVVRRAADDRVLVEGTDTNRPDLWSAEGIARQVRLYRGTRTADAVFPTSVPHRELLLRADDSFSKRIAAAVFAAVPGDSVGTLLETAERLSFNFGRQRTAVDVVVFDASALSGQKFTLWDNDGVGMSSDSGQLLLPVDATASSSRHIRSLVIVVVGTVALAALRTLNVLAADVLDRGEVIEAVSTEQAWVTEFGKTVTAPFNLSQLEPWRTRVDLAWAANLLGIAEDAETLAELATCAGFSVVNRSAEAVIVASPSYRGDVLHPVDVVEDLAIARGLGLVDRRTPTSRVAAGRAEPVGAASDRMRHLLAWLGFEEVFSHVLLDPGWATTRMNREGRRLVEVANPISRASAAARDSLLPCLLRVESRSSAVRYPHRLFEAGEVILPGDQDADPRQGMFVAAIAAHDIASISDMHAVLMQLARWLRCDVAVKPVDDGRFLRGRSAEVIINGMQAGTVGEIHPIVLERWRITVPVAALELDVTAALNVDNGTTGA